MLLILNKKIEDFLHHDYVRMVYTKKSSKIRLKFQGELGKKSVKRAYLSKIYQKVIKTVSKVYQSYIKNISKRYQNHFKRLLSLKPPQIRFKRLF